MPQTIGRYQIKRELGRGGMATVYLAFDPRFEREVAIKVLPRQFTHDPRFLARFEQEARTIAALEHFAIVPVYDFGEEDDAPYLVMRHMAGGSLRERMTGQPLPLSETSRILDLLAPALDKAHRRGIIHRDLKPGNVLFDEDDQPYLADFGIARMAEATHTMTVVGTPAYMSPEQVIGQQALDGRSDIYALGVMLFEMLSGKQPYTAQTPSGQMFMHVNEPVPDLLAANPDLPRQAQEVIEWAMAKDCEERCQSAMELAQAAHDLQLGLQELAEKPEALTEDRKEGLTNIAAAATVVETPPENLEAVVNLLSDPAARVKREKAPVQTSLLAEAKRGQVKEAAAKRAGLPAWTWWAGAIIVVLLLVWGIRGIFGGDNTQVPVEEAAPAEEEAMEKEAAAEEEAPAEEVVQEEVSADADALGIEPIRIAVVMPSTVSDLAWSQAIYDSLLRIQEDAGGEDVVEISYTENMFNVTDAAAAIRDYAADGYNLVIAHGTQYGTSMFEVAPDFPETSFTWGTAVDTGAEQGLENVFAYEARAEEGGFVNGVLAANLSETGVIGVVGPVEAGDAKLYIDGFVAGVMDANPDAQVNVSYTGSFGDTALAAEAANTHIQAGADVLTGSAQQVVGAIGVAAEQGVPWLGTQSDQSPIAPEIVVASQLYDWDGVLLDIIHKHQAGEYGGTAYALTLANGGLVMDFNEGLDADAVAAAEESEAEIMAGNIDVMAMIEGTMAKEPTVEEEEMAEEGMAEMEYPELEPVRIALVLPNTTTDLAWSQSIYDSLVLLQEHYGEENFEISYTENMFNTTDAAAAIRFYAESGYNLVIAHGAQYGTSIFELAPDFPDTSFAWGTTTNYGEEKGVTNVFAYEPRAEEGGYVSGVLAANLTESGIIGLVGPIDAGDAKLHVDGFVAGVRDIDPDVQVNISFTGSFGDVALAAEAANTHIQAGADVLTGSSQQVVGAIGVASEAGVPWLGIQADQSLLAPDTVVATVLYEWRSTILEMLTSQQASEMGGRVLQLTLENGGQTMIYADSLPEEAVAAAEEAKQGIMDGSIEIVAEPR